jgi:HK97 family phage prohead protease
MRDFEAKNFSFEVKATGDNEFEGYASVFRNVDSYRDIIEPGAFTKTIQESKRVKVLWQHDPHATDWKA